MIAGYLPRCSRTCWAAGGDSRPTPAYSPMDPSHPIERRATMTGQLDTLMDSTVYDSHDDKIGKVKNIYVNNETGSPTWASVSTGLFRHDSLVPLVGAQHNPQSDALRVNVDKEMVKSAPAVEQDGHISREGEEQLFRHYHVDPNHSGWDAYGRAMRDGQGTARPDAAPTG